MTSLSRLDLNRMTLESSRLVSFDLLEVCCPPYADLLVEKKIDGSDGMTDRLVDDL